MAGPSTHPQLLVQYHPDAGLTISLTIAGKPVLAGVPVRVEVRGANTFVIWGVVDSGETPPAWAEPDYRQTFFGGERESPGVFHFVETVQGQLGGGAEYRAIGVGERCAVTLEISLDGEEVRTQLTIHNPQPPGGKSLPLCLAELRFEDLTLGPETTYTNAHAYGGSTHGFGKLSDLEDPGVIFVHGCIGQALPLVLLHDAKTDRGLMLEFMMDGRPVAWLKRGTKSGAAHWCITWSTHRLLAAGEAQAYGGEVAIAPFANAPPWMQICKWRDDAAKHFGLVGCGSPDWVRRANFIEFNMNPENGGHAFKRLDDPKCREMFKRWSDMGYNAIFGVSPNHVGQNWLSPFDYEPRDEVGGAACERQMLAWAHELGFHIILWVTTVGIDRDAPEVKEHPDWFTHRINGAPFYAWDSHAPDYRGYAPDGDPCSRGWRNWLKNQVKSIVARGYDGIFIDGCIPRADNHSRWTWPGEGRNGVEDQVCELASHVRRLGRNLLTYVEDESPATQATCELTMGRYTAIAPNFKKAYADHGMAGGPAAGVSPPTRIPPELAREYLLIRYASILPGHLTSDVIEGYFSEAARPWTVQSMLAGTVFKTHSQYVDDPATWRAWGGAEEPPAADKDPKHRLKGHEEFLKLLKLCHEEPLIRTAPLSIAGVTIEGDPAVVGILRPLPSRCLLALIQFAPRTARISMRLTEPLDIPASERVGSGEPHHRTWRSREVPCSMVDSSLKPAQLTGEIPIGPYGFRILELTPA